MTNHEAGLLGSLTEAAVRAMTSAELDRRATNLENSSEDGFLSVADEADLCLLNKAMERRDNEPDPAPPAGRGWFLATVRPRSAYASGQFAAAGPVMVLLQAKDGAEVEDVLRRHDLDSGDVQWEPLDGLRYGIILGELRVIPWEVQ